MTTSDPKSSRERSGAAHLARLSELRKMIQDEGLTARVLLVEDEKRDVPFIETPLKRLFGDGLTLDVAATVKGMADALKVRKYDIVLLDDLMDAKQQVETTLPLIRSRQAKVPVVVISRLLTRSRKADLQRLNVTAVHEKDDLDSVLLCEAVIAAIKR